MAPGLDIDILIGSTIEDVVRSFEEHQIDTVIMDAGIDLDVRLDVIRHVFTARDATTVHMKDRSSGRDGMMPFVNAVLTGLAGQPSFLRASTHLAALAPVPDCPADEGPRQHDPDVEAPCQSHEDESSRDAAREPADPESIHWIVWLSSRGEGVPAILGHGNIVRAGDGLA